jgi:demethylmenaquinone methyltransferase/2-methoxy-6-polyprenyl-1,4-benzoquinol methylase
VRPTTPQYDPVALDYERLIAPRYARVAALVAEAIDVREGDAVLDVAAGTGGVARLILPRLGGDGMLALVDLSPRMLAVGRHVLEGAGPDGVALAFEVADLESLPFPDDAFDHVVAQFTPLQDSDRGLAEAARVLRRGGALAVAFWGDTYRELELLNRVRARVGIELAAPPDPGAVAARVEAAGFEAVRVRTVRLDAEYPDADAYLAYRAAFGHAVSLDEDVTRRYWSALEDEVRRLQRDESAVRLDWTVALLTARRR